MRPRPRSSAPGELSRAADIINQALTEMTGATCPRLHLELLMARLLLPAADATERGLAARLDRIERRLAYGGAPGGPDAGSPAPGLGAAGAGGPGAEVPDAGRPAPVHDGVPSGAPSGAASGLSGAALARAAMKRAEHQSTSVAEPSPAPAPEAPGPQVTPSADWGGGWGVMPEPQSRQPETDQPAPSSAEQPAPGRAEQAPVPNEQSPVQGNQAPARADQASGHAAQPPAEGGQASPSADQLPAEPSLPEPSPAVAAEDTPQEEREFRQPAEGQAQQRAQPSQGQPSHAQPAQDHSSQGEPGPGRPSGSRRRWPRAHPQGQPAASASQVEMIRRAWPEVLSYLEEHSRLVWMLVSQNASVAGFDGQLLTIGFSGDGPRDTVQRRGGDQVIAQAVHAVLGIQPRLDLITGGSAPAGGPGPKAEGRPAPAAPRPDAVEEPDAGPAPATPDAGAPAPVPPASQRATPERAAAVRTDPAPTESQHGTPDAVGSGQAAPDPAASHRLAPEDTTDDEELEPRSEPVEEGATGPGTPPPPEDLDADSVPVSDWYGEEPHDDAFPPPPDPDEDDADDADAGARPGARRP